MYKIFLIMTFALNWFKPWLVNLTFLPPSRYTVYMLLVFFMILITSMDCSMGIFTYTLFLTLSHTFAMNLMWYNVSKCYTCTFSRKSDPVIFSYKLSNTDITSVTTICDLGITFDNKLLLTSILVKLLIMYQKRSVL